MDRLNPSNVYDHISVGRDEPKALEDVGYTQVTRATGDTHVHVSGTASMDSDGEVVGEGDYQAQFEQVLKNIENSLEAADAEMSDVVRIRIYCEDPKKGVKEGFPEVKKAFGKDSLPAATIMGVDFAFDEYLIEIEAYAVI